MKSNRVMGSSRSILSKTTYEFTKEHQKRHGSGQVMYPPWVSGPRGWIKLGLRVSIANRRVSET